jgi:hypothetical protein
MSIDISKIEAIDPPGCGCMECTIGEYIPLDSPYIGEVFEAILNGEISPRNNQNDGTLIIYRMNNGRIYSVTDPTMVRRSDMVIIPPTDSWVVGDGEDVVIDVSILESEYDATDEDKDRKAKLISSIVMDSAAYSNSTDDTYIAYRSPYGDTGVIDLPGVQSESDVAILLYDD